ncbi:hypothetical protein O9992_17695 [Vibrio lentus]|nr:hypothetical protein [Vibrio lentus]
MSQRNAIELAKKGKESAISSDFRSKTGETQGYQDVQYNEGNQTALTSALEDNDEVLVMAYSDGKVINQYYRQSFRKHAKTSSCIAIR